MAGERTDKLWGEAPQSLLNLILCCYAIVHFVRQIGQSSRKVLLTFQESCTKPGVNQYV
jgi:hypothetical protein